MRVLVDTNIWIDHFNRRDEELSKLLHQREVVTHELVIGELACGNLSKRDLVLEYLREIPTTADVAVEEAIQLVETRQIYGTGLGLIDCLLLASVLITPRTRLWTRDRRLAAVAVELGVGL